MPISYFSQRFPADIADRIVCDGSLSRMLGDSAVEAAADIFAVAAYLAVSIFIDPYLALAAVFLTAVSAAANAFIKRGAREDGARYRQTSGEMIGALAAGLSVMGTLKASGSEHSFGRMLLGRSAKKMEYEQRVGRRRAVATEVAHSSRYLAAALIVTAGAAYAVSVGGIVASAALFVLMQRRVDGIDVCIKKLNEASLDMKRSHDMETFGGEAAIDRPFKPEGRVTVRDAVFGYSRLAPPVLTRINMDIDCGDTVAIVGRSGSGKSTLAALLCGLYEPWSGEVLIDGKVTGCAPAGISIVSQNVTLFPGTVRDNITMWNRDISEEDVTAAAKDACIHDVITKKPGAYEYVLSDGGSNFSGGQRRRIEIARALATNPTIVILDEATGALDARTESSILLNIKRRGCTCIIISHRQSAVKNADEIYMIENGRIAWRGTHRELSLNSGAYGTLFSGGAL